MKSTTAVFLIFTFSVTPAAFPQGSLTPPGPPAPTMLRLDELGTKVDQVEKRTPISSLPFTISASGSYYLTKNLTYNSTGDLIAIQAADVVLDLNGFNLKSTSSTTGVAGIRVNGSAATPLRNVVVRNGTIDGSFNGVYAFYAENCAFRDLHVANQLGPSFLIQNSSGNLVSNVVVTNGAFSGLDFTGTDNDNHVADTTVTKCATGINLIATGSGNILERCVVSSNSGVGVNWSGASSGNVIRECSFVANATDGILLATSSVIGNRIDGNTFSKNGGSGMRTFGSKNVIVRNVFTQNTNPNVFSAGDVVGAMITTPGAFSSDQPWANFSY